MSECIFCKIVEGKIPSAKIWENEEFLSILDINPNVEGMALLITKKHYPSYAFDMPLEVYERFMIAAKNIAKLIENGLNVKRVALVMEGLGVNHAHLKLYPIHGLDKKFKEIWAKDKVYFEKYEGYISTQLGPQKTLEELEETAKKIRNNKG